MATLLISMMTEAQTHQKRKISPKCGDHSNQIVKGLLIIWGRMSWAHQLWKSFYLNKALEIPSVTSHTLVVEASETKSKNSQSERPKIRGMKSWMGIIQTTRMSMNRSQMILSHHVIFSAVLLVRFKTSTNAKISSGICLATPEWDSLWVLSIASITSIG